MKKNKKNEVSNFKLNRRKLIIGASSIGAISLAPKNLLSQEANSANLPPNVPEWTPYLGDGVDVNPYGMPSNPFYPHITLPTRNY